MRYVANNPINETDPSGLEEHPANGGPLSNSPGMRDHMLSEYGRQPQALLRKRYLTVGEAKLCREVFGNQIDVSKAFVGVGGWPGQGTNAVAPFDTAYFPPQYYKEDFSKSRDDGLFIHEMTHIWQTQRGVNVALKNGKMWVQYRGVYNDAYSYDGSRLSTTNFDDLSIEQQAALIQDYYNAINTVHS